MVVGAISSRTELAVIGAGPGGYVAALRAADAGLDVTLIDRAELGGTCLNVGCIPSKALIEIAQLRHNALTACDRGLTAQVGVDAVAISNHLSAVSRRLRGGIAALLQDAGVTVVAGTASFARYDRLSIADNNNVQHLEFDNAIIATGSRPMMLDAFPLDERTVSSTGALALSVVPHTMSVIGGGYIGVELGTAWAKLGAIVTIVEAAASILPHVSPSLRQPVERRLNDLGITVLTGVMADHPTDQGLVLDTGHELAAEIIVVAVGRRPNSDEASIETLGLTIDEGGHILVDAQMRAKQGIFAIGDLTPGPALAHKASAQAETAVNAILGGSHTFTPAAIPEVIFSDPEILSVGVSLDDVSAHGLTRHRFPHVASARAHTIDKTAGATYVIADDQGTVVGVHAVGPHVSELAGEAALAIEMAATVEDLAGTIHPHPTMSESVAEASWLATGHPLHVRR
jgi:dihydrolipoamide dehydrogenase